MWIHKLLGSACGRALGLTAVLAGLQLVQPKVAIFLLSFLGIDTTAVVTALTDVLTAGGELDFMKILLFL